jgi:S-adenosylmethionine synthetase
LCQKIYSKFPYDGKTQITVELSYGNNHDFVCATIKHIVVSWQKVSKKELSTAIANWVNNLPEKVVLSDDCGVSINPAGDWDLGGFDADTGLTGRKIVIDSYGPRVPVGGGAFSGKDSSKVDRSAAYMARRIATDYLLKRHANEVYVYLAYALGEIKPVDTTIIIDGKAERIRGYDLSPRGIIEQLDLLKPVYEKRAMWGHFC